MAKVSLSIFPPLSYDKTTKSGGTLFFEASLKQGDTLGSLLERLQNENYHVWQNIFDAQTNRIKHIVVTILNDTRLSPSTAMRTLLSDGDQITFVMAYGGG